MKIENLQEGQVLKNYKELCEVLDIPIKSGNTKKSQLKELECYVKYHKQGNAFVIDEIYNNPLPKIDNRIDGNNSIYANYIDKLILHECNRTYNSKYNYILLSMNGLLLQLHMINKNYTVGIKNINQFSNFYKIPVETIHDFYDSTYKRNKSLVESALNRLSKKSLIFWTNVYKVALKNGEHRLATDREIEVFLNIEQEVYELMGYESKKEVFLNGQWNYYIKKVNGILRERTDFSYYYKNYKIITTKAFRKMFLSEEDKESLENELNATLYSANIKSAEHRHEKTKAMYKKADIGRDKIPTKQLNRVSGTYIFDSKRIANIVIDNNIDCYLLEQLDGVENKKYSYEEVTELVIED